MRNSRNRLLAGGLGVMLLGAVGVPPATAHVAAEPAGQPAAVAKSDQDQLLALAKTYLQSRTAALLSDSQGRPLSKASIAAVPLSAPQQRVAQAVDLFLAKDRQNLEAHKQRWTSAETTVVPTTIQRQPDGSVQATVTEKTRLLFDRKLDPEAPVDTAQSVDRVFTFVQQNGTWTIASMRAASADQTVALNDAPRAVVDAAAFGASPMIDVPEYNYGIPGPLSAGDQAEDQQPEPDPDLPLADAPEDGTPTAGDKDDGAAAARLMSGYCYSCMVSYANTYWDIYNTSYRAFSNDCTNFISQALKYGGWAYDYGWYRSGSNWWYNRLNQTYTWSGAENWSHFAPKRTSWLSSVWYLLRADVLLADWDHNGAINHAMIVTQKTSSMVYLSYHTNDSHNTPLSIIISHNPGTTYYAART
ncbi:amidase domain-containing protein [Kribbella sp. NPDC026611]|uniref:amidase domain-containing protein n=1 Tax=Kribbella sp. NPDC026611 TaxID=3154911 RepID=UPI0034027A8B